MSEATCERHTESINGLEKRMSILEISHGELKMDVVNVKSAIDDINRTLLSVKNWIIGGVAILAIQNSPSISEVLKKLIT